MVENRHDLPSSGPLTLEQFREAVLERQTARARARGKTYFPPVPRDQLEVVEEDFRMRREAASRCRELLAAGRAALAAAKRGGDDRATKTRSIGICSAYRDFEHDERAWRDTFEEHYNDMIVSGTFMGQEHGRGALQHMFTTMLPLKAAPGFSNHSNGTAVDFKTTFRGKNYFAKSKQREGWRTTWFHPWLVENAGTFGFRPLASEEWHWDFG